MHRTNLRRPLLASIVVATLLLASPLLAQRPFVRFISSGDTIYWYSGAPLSLSVIAGPSQPVVTTPGASITTVDREIGEYRVSIDKPREGVSKICLRAGEDDDTASTCVMLVVEEPKLWTPVKKWLGMRAVVGEAYNPSSDWRNISIPENHYRTVVKFNGQTVLDEDGTHFIDNQLPRAVVIGETTREIETVVYWKPFGSADKSLWVPLLSNVSATRARLTPEDGRVITIYYARPEHSAGYEFTVDRTQASKETVVFGPIMFRQHIGHGQNVQVENAVVDCSDCSENGLDARLKVNGDHHILEFRIVDAVRFQRSGLGNHVEIPVAMRGRGDAEAMGMIRLEVTDRTPANSATGTPTRSTSGKKRSR